MSFALLLNPVRALSLTLPPSTHSVTLAWEISPGPEVAGYRVYYGAASGNYTNIVVAGNVMTSTISGLAGGVTYFFAVTAYDATGLESDFSDEISYTTGFPGVKIRVTPTEQVILKVAGLIGHTYEIQATQDFTTWTVIGTVMVPAGGFLEFTDPDAASFPRRFYRTRDIQP